MSLRSLCPVAVLFDGGEVFVLAFVQVQADTVEAEQVDGFVHVGAAGGRRSRRRSSPRWRTA